MMFCFDARMTGRGKSQGLREMAIKKRPQTPLPSRTWIVQDPPHREANARTDSYPCQMSSVQSLYTVTAQSLDILRQAPSEKRQLYLIIQAIKNKCSMSTA